MRVIDVVIAQTEAPARESARDASSTVMGLIMIGVFIIVVAALAYMVGRRRREQRLCTRCRAVLRGRFCPTCGMEAPIEKA